MFVFGQDTCMYLSFNKHQATTNCLLFPDIISNHQCTQCISEILPTTEDILCQLIDMLSLTFHSPELQLRVGDTGVQPLWARGSATRRLLSALGFLQVGPLLVFNKVASNRQVHTVVYEWLLK